jgi:uncharacterized repeat protein (TIGR01451 family)
MRLRAWRTPAISFAAVLVLVIGSAGQAFACVPPEQDSNLQIETSVGLASLSPSIGLSLGVDHQTAIPGDKLTYSAIVTNTGAILAISGQIEVSNPNRSATTIAAWYDFVSTDANGRCGQGDQDDSGRDRDKWSPLAGAVGAKPGYARSSTAPIATGMTFTAVPVPAHDVNYSTGSDTITGTYIGRGANARWNFTALIPLAPAQVATLFKGSAVLPIRESFHAEPPTGNSRDSDQATVDNADFCHQLGLAKSTGSATNVSVTLTLPDGTTKTIDKSSVPSLASIAPGASATVTATYTVPVPAAKGATETDAAYVTRLVKLDGAVLTASATAKAGTSGPTAGPAGPVSTREHLPIASVSKSGPATVDAGKNATYSLALANTGSAAVSSLTIADSLPDGTLIPTTGAPASLAPGGKATAQATYTVPAAQPAGNLTDTATLRWTDANGNPYGPISSSATTTVTRPIATVTVTVTASSGSMTYGGTVPVITPAYSGWVNGEGPAVLTTAPTCSTTATSASGAAAYKTSCSGAVAANYTFVYVDGSVTVNPARVTVTASSGSMAYGGTVPVITPAYAGWVNGDGPAVLTRAPLCTTTATSASPAGT